jgi:ABC-type Fe3+/spermidine/putrescine transport system ATPase subunit
MAIRRVFQSAPCTALEASLPGAAKAAAEAAAPARAPSGLILEVNDVVHSYGPVMALDHVSLSAKRGEFLTILGESGSGKTTMLRVISGLEVPSSVARLAIDGVDVTGVPAAQRNCTTVFQSYALFPHMSVEENVAYGLKLRKVGHEERRERTRQALALVRLGEKGARRIGQLSGGERQRVALARALVTRPAILLLDEPLGALDERLRFDMQAELVEIHRTLGITFIYITHSQEEALTMSDRIVLMRRGRIEQSGTPEELFDRPVSRFSAEFMGFENILPCTVLERSGKDTVRVDAAGVRMNGHCPEHAALEPGASALLAVRAERLTPVSQAACGSGGQNLLPCEPLGQLYRGKYTDRTARIASGNLKIRTWDQDAVRETFDAVSCRPQDCVVLPN